MSTCVHDRNRALISRFRDALYNLDGRKLNEQLNALFAPDALIQLAHPLGNMIGPAALFEHAYRPLITAIPDLERRDYIVAAGPHGDENWVGCAGFYMGVFERPWLGIPATRHVVTMRYSEFFEIEGDRIIAMHAMWDIPEVMMQARAWPMSPSVGREMHVPGPATQDGIVTGRRDPERSEHSLNLVNRMVNGLGRYAEGGMAAMQLERYWHPQMNWYGPSGIGSGRRISGFRNWHQIPFLAALPDRGSDLEKPYTQCFFGDGDYVAFCGFNAMYMTVSGDGWLGIAPGDQKIRMTSLDFWRCEAGWLRENWVQIDILDIFRQLGVDVLGRMREYTVDRQLNPPAL
ncbi:MAG: putative ester cyclase [Halieaceae bacterium]